MSLKSFFNSLKEIEVDITWCHWNRLGAMGSGRVNKCSTDPEALILLTSIVGEHNPRLIEVMNEWLGSYESLISIERLKRYIKELNVNEDMSDSFNILKKVISGQRTNRWKSISNLFNNKILESSQKTKRVGSKKLDIHERIIQRNLQLCLRLMLGVGTRADVIYYLLVVFEQSKNPSWFVSTPQISKMLHYNNSSIHRTVQDLEQAGFLGTRPSEKIIKNKSYFLDFNNTAKLTKNIFRWEVQDRHYVDWFKIVQIFLLTAQLQQQLEDITEDSIIKSRLQGYIQSCALLIYEADIDIKNLLSTKAFYPALIRIGMDELQSRAASQIQGIYEFVTAKI